MSEVSYKFALEADNLLQNNEFEKVIALCEAGLLKYPNYPLAMALLAKAYYLSNEIDSAKIIINAAEKRYPINLSIINIKRQIYNEIPELENNNVAEDIEIEENMNIEFFESKSSNKDKYDVSSQLEEIKNLTNILNRPPDDESFIKLSIDEENQNDQGDIGETESVSFDEDTISDALFDDENLVVSEEEDVSFDVSSSELTGEEISTPDVATVLDDFSVSSSDDVEDAQDLSFDEAAISDVFLEEDTFFASAQEDGALDISTSEFQDEEFSALDVATELASSSADVEEPAALSFEDAAISDVSFEDEDLVVSEEEDVVPDVSSSEFTVDELYDAEADVFSVSDSLKDDIEDNEAQSDIDNSFVRLDEIVELEEQIAQDQHDVSTEDCDLENEYDVLASDLIETEEDNNKLGLKSIVVDESSSKGFSFPYEEIKEETVYIKNANFLYKIDLNYSQDDYLPIKNNFNVDPDEHIFNSVNIDNVDFLLEENLKNNASQKFNIDDLSQIAKQVETAKITPVTETVEEEDDNFEVIVASETMAKIFVKQKAYKKAIKVYEMLISEKPDKKEYFGQQIKELEEKL
ncbi:MAG: hypothetical protein GX372_03225 [Ignavibacteria bacterium]|jgi:hypothetical protein|nr:hypothetical protein [Ignavibacteria bacterium]